MQLRVPDQGEYYVSERGTFWYFVRPPSLVRTFNTPYHDLLENWLYFEYGAPFVPVATYVNSGLYVVSRQVF
jgi:hypothetical protein